MKYFLLCFLLVGCSTASVPSYIPADNDEYIEQLEAQSDQEIKVHTLSLYSYAGIGLFVAGVGMLSFTPRIRSAALLMAGGALAMASPFILNSAWFQWLFGTATGIALLGGLYVLYRLVAKYLKTRV